MDDFITAVNALKWILLAIACVVGLLFVTELDYDR